jgi:hypothetical protein
VALWRSGGLSLAAGWMAALYCCSLGICIDAVGKSGALFWACGGICLGASGSASVAGVLVFASVREYGWLQCALWLACSLASLLRWRLAE